MSRRLLLSNMWRPKSRTRFKKVCSRITWHAYKKVKIFTWHAWKSHVFFLNHHDTNSAIHINLLPRISSVLSSPANSLRMVVPWVTTISRFSNLFSKVVCNAYVPTRVWYCCCRKNPLFTLFSVCEAEAKRGRRSSTPSRRENPMCTLSTFAIKIPLFDLPLRHLWQKKESSPCNPAMLQGRQWWHCHQPPTCLPRPYLRAGCIHGAALWPSLLRQMRLGLPSFGWSQDRVNNFVVFICSITLKQFC